MNIAGIVCEYNPFHSGHWHQLAETRRALGADTLTVCVMSGDFVQRGEAAVFSKFARAEAACRAGADLVLELPLPWGLSSAEGFAARAVMLRRFKRLPGKYSIRTPSGRSQRCFSAHRSCPTPWLASGY